MYCRRYRKKLDPINLLVLPVANRKEINSCFFITIVQSNDFKITQELVEARFENGTRKSNKRQREGGWVESVQYSHVTDMCLLLLKRK